MGLKSAREKKVEEKNRLEFKENRLMNDADPFFIGDGVKTGEVVSMPYESLAPYDSNRDATVNLDGLMENIRATGHLTQPLRISKFKDASGKHTIIAGERRWRAIGMLREIEPKNWDYVDCIFSDAKDMAGVAFEALADNVDREDVSPADKVKMIDRYYVEYQKITDPSELSRLQYKQGFIEKLKGLKIGARDLRRLTSISLNTVPAIKALLEKGVLSAHTAEEISSLSEESQNLIAALADQETPVDKDLIFQFKSSEQEEKNIEKEQKALSKQLSDLGKKSMEDPSNLDAITSLTEKQKSLSEKKAENKRIRAKLGTDHKAINTKISSLSKSVTVIIKENPVLTADEKEKLKALIDKLTEFLNGQN